ncbi:MAG: hypothetical protein J7K82_04510, partial [Thermoproteales archaeon]|nr:hypothetical protein [Thermoproteales archaeon]
IMSKDLEEIINNLPNPTYPLGLKIKFMDKEINQLENIIRLYKIINSAEDKTIIIRITDVGANKGSWNEGIRQNKIICLPDLDKFYNKESNFYLKYPFIPFPSYGYYTYDKVRYVDDKKVYKIKDIKELLFCPSQFKEINTQLTCLPDPYYATSEGKILPSFGDDDIDDYAFLKKIDKTVFNELNQGKCIKIPENILFILLFSTTALRKNQQGRIETYKILTGGFLVKFICNVKILEENQEEIINNYRELESLLEGKISEDNEIKYVAETLKVNEDIIRKLDQEIHEALVFIGDPETAFFGVPIYFNLFYHAYEKYNRELSYFRSHKNYTKYMEDVILDLLKEHEILSWRQLLKEARKTYYERCIEGINSKLRPKLDFSYLTAIKTPSTNQTVGNRIVEIITQILQKFIETQTTISR